MFLCESHTKLSFNVGLDMILVFVVVFCLQSWEKTVDCYSPGQGLMPASFKVRTSPLEEDKFEEVLDPDFGESAIGRVAPVDSGQYFRINRSRNVYIVICSVS